MDKKTFVDLHTTLIRLGYGQEIEWQENIKKCDESYQFFLEYIWVVLNSGMKEQIARKIYNRILKAISERIDIKKVFRHRGKVKAIKYMMENYGNTFYEYSMAEDKLLYLESLNFIGKITKYHLAKNLGENCVKPDRHLLRIAKRYNTTPNELCEKLSKETGLRKATVDIILWRSANLGIIE